MGDGKDVLGTESATNELAFNEDWKMMCSMQFDYSLDKG